MRPILFTFPDWIPVLGDNPLFSYGFMVGLGVIVAWIVSSRAASRDGIRDQTVFFALLFAVIFAVVGARVSHFLLRPDQWSGMAGFFRIDDGGLEMSGGIILGSILMFIYLRLVMRLSFWRFADSIAGALALLVTIVGIGACLSGSGFGRETQSGFSVRFPQWSIEETMLMHQQGSPAFTFQFQNDAEALEARLAGQVAQFGAMANRDPNTMAAFIGFQSKYHALGTLIVGPTSRPVLPAQPLAMGVGLLLFVTILWLGPRRRFTGQLALVFLSVYSLMSLALQAVSAEQNPVFVGLFSVQQWIAVGMFLAAVVFWLCLRRHRRLDEQAD